MRVKWVDPDENGDPVYHSISTEEAIKIQKDCALEVGYHYDTDQEALQDFITVQWAELVEV